MVSSNPKPGAIDRLAGFVSKLFNTPPPVNVTLTASKVWRGLPIYPNPNSVRYINEGYCGNASVYTIISTAARKFGFLPRYVYKIKDKNEAKSFSLKMKTSNLPGGKKLKNLQLKAYDEQVVDNQLSDLLNHPNPEEGQDTFYEKILTYYMATGEAFIHLNRGDDMYTYDPEEDEEAIKKMPVLEMRVMPSQYMEIIGDPDNVFGALYYQFDQNGKKIPIRKVDIIHWKRPNPKFDAYTRVHMRGLSPMEPGNKLVTQDDSASDAAVAMQQNDGAKAIIFNKQLSDLDATQKSQLESVINRKVNNRDLKGAVATVQGDWGSIDLSMSSVDMQLVEATEKIFIRLCNMWGIDPNMFLQGATYANKAEALKDMITGLLLPLACSLRDEMNRALLPAFNMAAQTYTHDVDVSTLPELQDDMSSKVTSLVQADWLTPNEKREAMNYERLEDPNMDKTWVMNNKVLMDDAAMTDLQNSFTDDTTGTADKNSGGNSSDTLPK